LYHRRLARPSVAGASTPRKSARYGGPPSRRAPTSPSTRCCSAIAPAWPSASRARRGKWPLAEKERIGKLCTGCLG